MSAPLSPDPPSPLHDPDLAGAERRVLRFTLACIAAAFAVALAHWGQRASVGVLAGGVLSLIHLYWIRSAADALVRRAAQQAARREAPRTRVGMVRALIHFGLLAAVFYAIFISHLLPMEAVLAGFFAAVGGIMLEAFWETVEALRGRSSAPTR